MLAARLVAPSITLSRVQDLLAVPALEQQVHLPEDDHERVVDLVGDAARQFADRGEPLGAHHLRLRPAQAPRAAARVSEYSARIVEGKADLVGHALEQRDLLVGEAAARLASQRERAEDAVARADRHADEAPDAVGGHGGARRVQEVAGPGDVVHAARWPDWATRPISPSPTGRTRLTSRRRGQAAIAAQEQTLAVGGNQMKARDLVSGDVGEGVERAICSTSLRLSERLTASVTVRIT